MQHYVIELALWVLAAYVVGCFAGAALYRMFGEDRQAAP
jgi:hypothetical protein